ncbi:hypothetical protein [Spiroplasma poulsonii]|uniref:hypothetical protein n=1 Tax=Spiroplasma poulsonii TaxID=2138 RepID=UPI001F4D1E7A|nr:hypothetical protein [Spiroplasma poulsonii]UNF61613.1 hypothetical protein MNU24_06795 [Spiroplasma poulsonii]
MRLVQLRKEIKQLQMENDIFKASHTDNGQNSSIKTTRKIYTITNLCKTLKSS